MVEQLKRHHYQMHIIQFVIKCNHSKKHYLNQEEKETHILQIYNSNYLLRDLEFIYPNIIDQ